MKNSVKLIIGGFAFLILLVAAKFGYDALVKNYDKGDNLKVVVTATPEVTEEENDSVTTTVTPEASENEEPTKEAVEEEKQKIVDFTMVDTQGNEVKLSSFIGKPMVINFWASWCGPCKSELPDFQAAYEANKDKVEFVMVNMTDGAQETMEKALNYIGSEGYNMPFYFDTKQEAAITYSVYSIPQTILVDEDGYITAYATGMLDADTLQQGIDMILPVNP